MMEEIETSQISLEELIGIHVLCDNDFMPPLSQRVKIIDYCMKLFINAEIISYRMDGNLQGIVAIYCNDSVGYTAYISSICVHPERRGQGLGARLLDYSISHAMEKGMKKIRLEVDMANSAAIALYSNRSFFATAEGINTVFMEKDL